CWWCSVCATGGSPHDAGTARFLDCVQDLHCRSGGGRAVRPLPAAGGGGGGAAVPGALPLGEPQRQLQPVHTPGRGRGRLVAERFQVELQPPRLDVRGRVCGLLPGRGAGLRTRPPDRLWLPPAWALPATAAGPADPGGLQALPAAGGAGVGGSGFGVPGAGRRCRVGTGVHRRIPAAGRRYQRRDTVRRPRHPDHLRLRRGLCIRGRRAAAARAAPGAALHIRGPVGLHPLRCARCLDRIAGAAGAVRLLHPRMVLIGGVSIVALFGVLYLMPHTHVRARLASAYDQLRISLSDFDNATAGADLQGCLQQQQLLQAWSEMAKLQSGAQVDIGVANSYVPAKGSPWPACKERGTLWLKNRRSNLTWVQLPHSARYGAKGDDLHLLAAGDAYFNFGDAPRVRLHTPPWKFVKVEMHSRTGTDDHFTVRLMNHADLWIVPVETYPGEFRYALADTSVGQRLEMWAVARRLFETAPLTGIGTGAYMASAQK